MQILQAILWLDTFVPQIFIAPYDTMHEMQDCINRNHLFLMKGLFKWIVYTKVTSNVTRYVSLYNISSAYVLIKYRLNTETNVW